MNIDNYKFHKEHCWLKIDGDKALIGITDYGQEELGDIVYIDMPDVGAEVTLDDEMTEIESTKTTYPIISPLTGKIIEVNEDLKENPEIINEDPYGRGWIAVIEISESSELEDLMDSKEYEEYIKDLT